MNISRQKIELLQAEKGISVTALAERSGVSRQNISTVKRRGTCNPITATKLAKGLGVSVAQIVEEV
ncbi:MAG: helix-turn-helix transcriptional regulator [Clostridium sp.]|nr:helix-turn-helix transcriptional regulator [Clostridium sp.]